MQGLSSDVVRKSQVLTRLEYVGQFQHFHMSASVSHSVRNAREMTSSNLKNYICYVSKLSWIAAIAPLCVVDLDLILIISSLSSARHQY